MAPPISMYTLSAAMEHQAISCPAHCLLRQSGRLLERRGHPSAWFRTMKREARQSHATGRRHPKQALVIRGAEITSVDRRLSCTPSGPVAQNSRDNSGTSPSDLFQQLEAKWQQRPPRPALISRFGAGCSHSVLVPYPRFCPETVPVAATWDHFWSSAEMPAMAFIGPPPTPRDAGDQSQKRIEVSMTKSLTSVGLLQKYSY